MDILQFIPETEKGKNRTDSYLSEASGLTRSRISALIREGRVTRNAAVVSKPSEPVRPGETYVIALPDVVPAQAQPEDIPITILWEDDNMAVIDKPGGMVVHPAAGNETGTLVNALLFHLDGLSGIGGEARPGIVHRLDKDTSGLLVVAKNDRSHLALSEQFKRRTMEKHYRAVVYGTMNESSGLIDKPIGRHPVDRKKMAIVPDGRPSQTEWTLLEVLGGASYLDVHILTGRTHQIRVHMLSVGHPVLGDPIYGEHIHAGVGVPRLMLHAYQLSLDHPITGERMTFTAPIPEKFEDVLRKLRNKG